MEVLLSLSVLLMLTLSVGGLLGIIAFFKQQRLADRLLQTEREIGRLQTALKERSAEDGKSPETAPVEATQPPQPTPTTAEETTPETIEPERPESTESTENIESAESADHWGTRPATRVADPTDFTLPVTLDSGEDTRGSGLFAHLRQYWMIWLGGGCVGLAGIFMVRYSIEQGLLGPGARILLSLLTGVALHILAYWLRHKRGSSEVFASLAGGASIVLYAALLASLHQLSYVPPGLIFAGMALVSLATLALALLHGPLLAALGMLGGYLVPILVSTGSQQIEGALIYAFILSLSVLMLLRYVWRLWLWCGVVIGALAWWALSFHTPPSAEVSRTLYLLGIVWGLLAVPRLDWFLTIRERSECNGSYIQHLRQASASEYAMLLALLLVIAAQGITLFRESLTLSSVWSHLLIPLLLLHAASRRPLLTPLPGVALITLASALLCQFISVDLFQIGIQPPLPVEQDTLIALLSLMTLLATGYGGWNLYTRTPLPGIWASIGTLTPLMMLAVAYLVLAAVGSEWRWGGAAFALGLIYLALARQLASEAPKELTLTLIAAAHLAYSLAVAIGFQEATLTLALALQLISLAAIHQRYPSPLLPWLIRLVILAVGCRLTLNPWVITYSGDVHWSLWTYGGSTLSCFIAAHLSRNTPSLQAWLQGAAATLLVLTLGTELRYWLYDGQIFGQRYGFTEAAINTLIWGSAALVYYWRASLSEHIAGLYRVLAGILLLMAIFNHLVIIVFIQNPLWGETLIQSTPIWNRLLLAYGAPTLLLLAVGRYYHPSVRPWAMLGCGLNLLLFISLEIRHLWQGALSIFRPTDNPELYTYSAVWLLLSAIGMVLAISRGSQGLYRGAMALLVVVIVKIFLVDMSGLDGLLRVASFMGLGLVLLLLAWLHQQLRTKQAENR